MIQRKKRRIAAKLGASHEEELAELLKEHPELLPKANKLYEEHLIGESWAYYLVFGALEIGATILIVWYAWKWRLS